MPGRGGGFRIGGADFGRGDVVDFKSINKSSVLENIWGYAKKYVIQVALVVAFMLTSNLLLLLTPVLTGRAIQALGYGAGNVDWNGLYRAVLLLALSYVGAAVLSWGQNYFMIYVTQNAIYDMRVDLFNRISEMPMSFFDNNYKGDLISRLSYDIDNISSCFSTDLIQLLTGIITLAGSFTMMFVISPPLTFAFLIIVPCAAIFTFKLTRYTRNLFREQQKNYGRLNAYVEEMLTGQKTVKAYCYEQRSVDQFEEINNELNTSAFKAQFGSSTVMPSMNFLNNLGFLIASSFGGYLMLRGGISLEGISSFVLYSKKFAGPINETANILGIIQSAFAAAERVFATRDCPIESNDADGTVLTDIKGSVVFSDVSFAYKGEDYVVKNFDLEVRPGQTVAIVGHTGAGKTTITNLLMRFYEVDAGSILIDSQDISRVERLSLRRQFGMVLQDTWLFTGTVADNISYGRRDATRDEIAEAAKAVNAHDFIMKMPNGYDTVISEDSAGMSQGQKQLLTIARALLCDPAMLILDEATSNVDTITEHSIQRAMDTLMRGRTSFVVAHRLSTIVNADQIIVMEGGALVEKGNHNELMNKKGHYFDLYNSQFSHQAV